MTASRDWRKSSFSGQEEDCVAVANDLKALRDTKNPDVELAVDVSAFAAAIKSGAVDR